MALTIENGTAIHEAGHCIISYLASDFFEIELVTINLELSKLQDSTSLGGLKGRLTKEAQELTSEEHDLIILILLAGMAADDVNHCECKLNNTLYDTSEWVRKIELNKYSGDVAILRSHLAKLQPKLVINQRAYTISCQKLLHEILTTGWITELLILIRNKIVNSPDKTISGKEINSFLDSTDLKNWKENEWPEIFSSRIKMYNVSFFKRLWLTLLGQV